MAELNTQPISGAGRPMTAGHARDRDRAQGTAGVLALVDIDPVGVERIPAGTYSLDPASSTFAFVLTYNGVSKFVGHFEQVEARLEDGVLGGTAHVESIRTASAQLKDHLLGPAFFNAAETPTIDFRSTAIGTGNYRTVEIDGELTIRGVRRSVTARGSVATGHNMPGAEVVGFDLEATIDRRDYGLNWQAQLLDGSDVLGWQVTLEAHLELAKAQPG
jgi:polyisoprenoid-binding protein YceI